MCAVSSLACGNIPFSSLFAAGDISRETSPAAKSEEKRMFSQAMSSLLWLNFPFKVNTSNVKATEGDEVGRSVGRCFQSRWLGLELDGF